MPDKVIGRQTDRQIGEWERGGGLVWGGGGGGGDESWRPTR